MKTNIPMVKTVAWISLIPQLLILSLIVFLFYLSGNKNFSTLAALSYLLLSTVLKYTVTRFHRKGIMQTKAGKFLSAVNSFEKSANFFAKYEWVDKYRYITALSSSKYRFKELALCNIAFCYSQIGNGQKALEYYKLVLKEFPGNGMATAGVNMINSLNEKQNR